MGIALQILGGLFVLILVLLVIAGLVIRAKLRRFASELGDALESVPPMEITLAPVAEIDWDDEHAAHEFLRPLPMLGFVEAGRYEIEEMPGVPLAAFVQPETHVVAVVYEHPQAGVILDMVTRYADETSITYTTTTEVGQLEDRPGHAKVSAPEASAEGLYRRLLGERPRGETVGVAPEEFPAVFEQAYADEMEWRMAKGGASEDEIRAIAEHSGMETSPDEIDIVRRLQHAQAMANIEDALRERFSEETTMSVAEWERVEDLLVFVHDQYAEDDLRECLEDWTGEEWPEIAAAGTPRARFAAANAALPAQCRCRLLGTVDKPVEADVYAAPTAMCD